MTRRRLVRQISLCLLAAAAAGCEPEPRHVGSAAPGPAPAARPEVPTPPAPDHGFIVGKRTQDIRAAAPELQKGARIADTRITAKDPITLQGNAYVSIIGQAATLNIQHAVDLYHAMNDRYPKDLQEFMTDIIKANNIALPVLPSYQEYGYDEKAHKLVVLEYPDRKAAPAR